MDGEITIQIFSSLYTWYLHDHRTKLYHMTSDKLFKTRGKNHAKFWTEYNGNANPNNYITFF